MDSTLPRLAARMAFDPELTGRKMIFLAGPRQAGKTTLAREWLARRGCSDLYFSWDDPKVRAAHRRDPHFFESAARALGRKDPWIALDEIHKASRWRDLLKGWFDLFGGEFRFLVTGSSRLDLLRRGGDSLVGRYFLFHLFPLSMNEVLRAEPRLELPAWLTGSRGTSWHAPPAAADEFPRYFERGPFPEPFLAESDRFARRWRDEYLSLVIRGELRDLTRIVELDRVETLVSLLPGTVGSPLSFSSLARDLEVAHTTVKQWMEALSRLFLVFGVPPHHRRVRRALRKERKWYFTDWSHVSGEGARLENLVASALWQACRTWTEAGHGAFELRYFRTLDGTEIDFVVLREGKPAAAVEVKQGDLKPSPPLVRRAGPLGAVPGIQVVGMPGIARRAGEGLWVVSAERFLCTLP
jgi:predicted AAA+ superfamily ATPase